MNTENPSADLHVHTTASDGTSTVEERIAQARERGVDTISITDHDRISTDLDSAVNSYDGIDVITGVEVRADIFDTKIEILGYFVDSKNSGLSSLLDKVRDYRKSRNKKMLGKLSEKTNLDIDYECLAEETDGSVGRPHMADFLVENRVVGSVGEAFELYLGDEGDCYVPMERVGYKEVIDTVHEAGGVASLAHPGRIRSERVEEIVEVLCRNGLDAIEVWYPYGEIRSEEYADIGVEEAYQLSEKYGLLKTGGSDCHGPGSGKFRLGEVGVSQERLEELRNVFTTQ